MKLLTQTNKKIGIFGLGLTGCSVFSALEGIAQTILCWDDSSANREQFILKFGDISSPFSHASFPRRRESSKSKDWIPASAGMTKNRMEVKDISDEDWQLLDKIVVSPGIPNSHAIFALIKKYNIAISSDIALFLEENPKSKIIVVTGTNGKSTTTALIGHILRENGLDYHVGGNIGLPVLMLPKQAEGYVLELSSFQLDLLQDFNPFISVLLNITPDHLDRYENFEEYCKSKYKAFNGDGIKIIGVDSDKSREFYTRLKSQGDRKLIPISASNQEEYVLPALKHLQGKHNRENIAAAFAVCRSLGVSSEEIIKHIASFEGLKHRMQYLGTKNNVSFYNDSKATNASSAACSLASLDNIFWLAGGIFKEESLSPIESALKNVKKAYLFGKNKLLFAQYLENKVEYQLCMTMKEAFQRATCDACSIKEDANILLAPACASYDQFKNFEDRGNQFIELYNAK